MTQHRNRFYTLISALVCGLICHIATADPLVVSSGLSRLTVEAFANVTAGIDAGGELGQGGSDEGRLDSALRLLGQREFAQGPDVGARIVVRTSPEDRLEIGEASLLLLGKVGRLEIGERQGLPDVLVGYSPNNFTFTGAEFGPASGPSLDPGGGLQLAFLGPDLASRLRPLSSLGFTATLADDESTKALYVSPKYRGLLAGISYASDATDTRYGGLVQAGLTHDTYWASNTLHIGGSYSFATGERVPGQPSVDNLHSINAGATLVLDYDLQIGLSVTYDGTNGRSGTAESSTGHAVGTVGSINYNHGPWTVGGYLQWAESQGRSAARWRDEMRAGEAGLSYRTSTRVRIYGAYYYVDFTEHVDGASPPDTTGGIVLAGLRVNL